MARNLLIGLLVTAALVLGWWFWPAGDPPPVVVGDANAAEHAAKDASTAVDAASTDARRLDADRVPVASGAPANDPEPAKDPETDADAAKFGKIELTVVWAGDRKPAADVRVIVSRSGGPWDVLAVARTDAAGHATIDRLKPGRVYLKVVRGGESGFSVRAGKATQARLAIPVGVTVQLAVVDGSQAPVADAEVWLSERWRSNTGSVVGTTDTRGVLTLPHVSPDCSLAVRRRGYEPSPLHPIRRSVGSEVKIRVTLRRGGGMVAGIVVDPANEPIAGARVLIGAEDPSYTHRTADGSWSPGAPPVSCTSDTEGRFASDATPPGTLSVQVKHPEYATYRGTIEAVAAAPVPERIELAPAAVLFGTVTGVDGQVVPSAQVRVDKAYSFAGRLAFTDAQGKFEIGGLASGEREVRVSKKELEAGAKLQLVAGQRLEWNPVLRPAADGSGKRLLFGRVVDARGKPLRNWRVAARAMDSGSTTVSSSTNREGKFEFAVPFDEMRVWTHPPRGHSGFPPLLRDHVRVDDGELLLRVEAANLRSGRIQGMVVDVAGKPLAAQIQCWHEAAKLWRAFDTAPETGKFEIENVPPGPIELKITSDRHAWKKLPTQTLEIGQDLDLGRIELRAGAVLTGRLTIAGGSPPRVAKVQVHTTKGEEAAVVQYADGAYRSGALVDGTYNLLISGDRFARVQRRLQITGGQSQELDFQLTPAALRQLEFTLAAGAKRPRFLTVSVWTKKMELVWNGGFGPSGPLRTRFSVVPGEYTIRAYGPGNQKWLDAPIRVGSLEDIAEPLGFTVRPGA